MAVGLSASEGRASVSIQPRWRGRSCAKEEERGPASGKGPIWGPSETEHGYGLWMVRRCWPSSAVRTILLLVRRYSQTVDVGRRGAPVTWILPGGGEAPCAFPEVVSARGVAVGARDFTGVAEGGGGGCGGEPSIKFPPTSTGLISDEVCWDEVMSQGARENRCLSDQSSSGILGSYWPKASKASEASQCEISTAMARRNLRAICVHGRHFPSRVVLTATPLPCTKSSRSWRGEERGNERIATVPWGLGELGARGREKSNLSLAELIGHERTAANHQ